MVSLPKLKVAFSDFWFGLDPERNFFTDVLRTRFDVEISSEPDVLFCSTFGDGWHGYPCPRVLFTGENIVPDCVCSMPPCPSRPQPGEITTCLVYDLWCVRGLLS